MPTCETPSIAADHPIYCLVQGEIPAEIGNLTNLKHLQLSYNAFIGSVPAELGSLKKLELIQLHANRISGTVTDVVLTKYDSLNYSLFGLNASGALNGTKSNYSFVADCGVPSAFDTPLVCPGCSMCCELLFFSSADGVPSASSPHAALPF